MADDDVLRAHAPRLAHTARRPRDDAPPQHFTATGGTAPHTWAISSGSALPPGLTLSAGGALTGTPTIPTAFGFFVKASDPGGRSVQKAFTIAVHPDVNPVPTLSSIAPSTLPQGSATTTIALIGSGFVPTSVARWDGSALATTFVDQTSLAAAIPDTLLASPGTHQVTVFSPAPGGGTSASIEFTITAVEQNPLPAITSVTPTFIPVSTTDTQITIVGSSFLPTTSAVIGTQGISTSYVSGTELHATIPASYLSAPGTLHIGVYNPPPGGGFSASTVEVTVGTPNPVPTLASISPATIAAGSEDFTLTLTGAGFVSGGQAFFDSTALATSVASSTSATATVPSSLVATARTASVTFVNPTPGGGASGPSSFVITGPPPAGVTCTSTYGYANPCRNEVIVENDVKFWLVADPLGDLTDLEAAITTSSPGILKHFNMQSPGSPMFYATSSAHTRYEGPVGFGVAIRSGNTISFTLNAARGRVWTVTGTR